MGVRFSPTATTTTTTTTAVATGTTIKDLKSANLTIVILVMPRATVVEKAGAVHEAVEVVEMMVINVSKMETQ